ncbi:Cysteine-rich CWC [Tepidimonas alkaliphilus]|uniref:Cysteine-rich CWC n=1 Tax=Tepidimonas alkaliphilus TaxID=2588942 RepID=A0A554W3Y2_9BURK|nr:cysteine-rich CWC family protein [Tepidimonas alkaliphilus]TSE18288.1 Cysteine-rich CWC [Tepidimonas alkaliphilus]
MSTAEPLPDPTRCPLCGGDNACAMEAQRRSGQPQPPCWCTRVTFAPELLARVPPAARGQACLCPRCAAQDADRPAC